MLYKLFTVYVYLQTLFCGCGTDVRRSGFERLRSDYKVKIERIGKLDEKIHESSGLAYATDSTFWTNPDTGSEGVLYRFNLNGELLEEVRLEIPIKDWEDLAQDSAGNLFIGDFGNNRNNRRDLTIYKLERETRQVTDTIRFGFADQTDFLPSYWQRHFDAEAFLHRSDSLFLFTKSRSFKGLTKIYGMTDDGKTVLVEPQGSMQVKSPITAAASAPDQKEFALLGYGRLYLFQPKNGLVSLRSKRYCLTVGRTGQAEAVLYLSPTQLLITNESGKLFLVTLEKK